MTYSAHMAQPRRIAPWGVGVLGVSALLLAGGLLDQTVLFWAGIAACYVGLLLARMTVPPSDQATASDLRLALIVRGVIGTFAIGALAGVALGLQARWLAVAAAIVLLGVLLISQFADNSDGFLATTRGRATNVLTWAYVAAFGLFVAITAMRL